MFCSSVPRQDRERCVITSFIRYCASWVRSRLIACVSFPACRARDGYLEAFLAFAQRFFCAAAILASPSGEILCFLIAGAAALSVFALVGVFELPAWCL
jgi:hypothetical protein